MSRATVLVLAAALLAGCATSTQSAGGTTGGSRSATPSAGSAGSATPVPASQSGAPAPSAATAAPAEPVPVDPCTLLGAADLGAFLSQGQAAPTRADADGHRVCTWGDGEFRNISLAVWKPGAGEQAPSGRTVDVAGRQGVVVGEQEYGCEIAVPTRSGTVDLNAISSDKPQWCPETATALGKALTKLGW